MPRYATSRARSRSSPHARSRSRTGAPPAQGSLLGGLFLIVLALVLLDTLPGVNIDVLGVLLEVGKNLLSILDAIWDGLWEGMPW